MFLLPYNEPFISAEKLGSLSQSPPCCTSMFLQKPRMAKQKNWLSKMSCMFFMSFLATVCSQTHLEGVDWDTRNREILSRMQYATLPLDATKSCSLDLNTM